MALKKRDFDKIVRDIKNVEIQGARNIARFALKAYFLMPGKKAKNILLNSRPTEPMMARVLNLAEKFPESKILKHFDEAQEKINKLVFKLIKNGDVIFTHCHSTNVTGALIYAKKHGKHFEVYNTETRPLYQGRRTAKELKKAGIKVTMFVDSALTIALTKEQGTKRANLVLIGADAITPKGVVNKVGSDTVSIIAKDEKIPFYVVADSWKYTNKNVPLEQRKLNEIWNTAPKKIKIKNPAFSFIEKKYIKAIVSELGTLPYNTFLKKARKN